MHPFSPLGRLLSLKTRFSRPNTSTEEAVEEKTEAEDEEEAANSSISRGRTLLSQVKRLPKIFHPLPKLREVEVEAVEVAAEEPEAVISRETTNGTMNSTSTTTRLKTSSKEERKSRNSSKAKVIMVETSKGSWTIIGTQTRPRSGLREAREAKEEANLKLCLAQPESS